MDKVITYAAVNAKIRALEKDFLKREDYLNMIQKKSVVGVARYLKDNTSYGKLLREINIDNISRRDLEDILKNNMIKNMDKFFVIISKIVNEFIHIFYHVVLQNIFQVSSADIVYINFS